MGQRQNARKYSCTRKVKHETREAAIGHARAIRGHWYVCPYSTIAEPHYHASGQPLMKTRRART